MATGRPQDAVAGACDAVATLRAHRPAAAAITCCGWDGGSGAESELRTFDAADFAVTRVTFDPETLGRSEIYTNPAYCHQADPPPPRYPSPHPPQPPPLR